MIEVDASGDKLRVKRELESGWYQWYSMPTPALLTIQSGISQIRYATLKGIMAAKKKEIKEVTPPAEIVGRPSHQQNRRESIFRKRRNRLNFWAMATQKPEQWRSPRSCTRGSRLLGAWLNDC